jgi:hypothetical protein
LDNTELVKQATDEWDKFSSGAIEKVTTVETINVGTPYPGGANTFAQYNGLSNVFYTKNKNITIDNSWIPSEWTDGTNTESIDNTIARTFIIENGNLYINKDIASSKNIAFIVKWGNIIIGENVTQIAWTYIAIKTAGGWWEIKWRVKTNNKLTINGSLYGDLTNLTNKRTHVSVDANWVIQVGTFISFGSSILNKPAPLVSQFITEYIESTKVAQ